MKDSAVISAKLAGEQRLSVCASRTPDGCSNASVKTGEVVLLGSAASCSGSSAPCKSSSLSDGLKAARAHQNLDTSCLGE